MPQTTKRSAARQTADAVAPENPSVEATPEADAERTSGRLTLLRISVGKEESIRPADLVGAIAGEAGVPSRVGCGNRCA